MKPTVLQTLASEIAFGLHELLRTDAANIHQSNDWFILFSLLEVVGACAPAPPVFQSPPTPFISKPISQSQSITNVDSDSECSDCLTNATATSDKGYTSDSEVSFALRSFAMRFSFADLSSTGLRRGVA